MDLSIVISAHDLRRELPRTVRSLCRPYQRDLDGTRLEIVVVDNGSEEPVARSWFEGITEEIAILRFAPGNPSPCHALNAGVAAASGEYVAVLIDGARMASPGMLARALAATRLGGEPFVLTMGFHLGMETQQLALSRGYGPDVEDRLLAEVEWPHDGYRLFEICARGESYRNGVLSHFPETNLFVMRRVAFQALGGFDERFRYRGGGLAGFEFHERVMSHESIVPILLVGEGTFHQVHYGTTTRANGAYRRETPGGPTIWEAMASEFEQIVGRPPLSLPLPRPLLFGRCDTPEAQRCFFAAEA